MWIKLRNLRRTVTVGEIERLLAPFSASEIFLGYSDRSPGRLFAYASIPDVAAAEVVGALDGIEFLDRRIEVVPARSRRWTSA